VHAAAFHLLAVLGPVMSSSGVASLGRDLAHALSFPALLFKFLAELDGPGLLDLKLLAQPIQLRLAGGKLASLYSSCAAAAAFFRVVRPSAAQAAARPGFLPCLFDLQGGVHAGARGPGLCRPQIRLGDAGMIRIALVQFLQKFGNLGVIIGLPGNDDRVK